MTRKMTATGDASVPQSHVRVSLPTFYGESEKASLRWSVDGELRVLNLQGPALSQFGLNPVAVNGTKLTEVLLFRDTEAEFVDAHLRTLRGESLSLQVRLAGRCFIALLEPTFDDIGKVSGVSGFAWPSTELSVAGEAPQRRYEAMVANSSEAAFLLTANGRIRFASTSCFRRLDCDRRGLAGKNFFEMVHPSDLAEASQAVEELAGQSGGTRTLHLRLRGRDGTWRWMECALANRLGEYGVGAVVLNARDVTDLRRAEIEREVFLEVIAAFNTTMNLDDLLAQVHGALQKALRAENCCVAVYHRQARTFHFPFFTDEVQTAPPVKAERSLAAYVYAAGEPMHLRRQALDELARTGVVELNGPLPSSILGVPLRSATATVGVLLVQDYRDEKAYSARDMELLASIGCQIALAIERKRAREGLRLGEREYEIIFQSAPSMIWYKDTENRILRANRAAAQSVGMAIEDLEGRSMYDLFPSEAVRYHQDDLEVVRTGEPKLGIIEPYRLPSGEVRTVRTDKIPYRNAKGKAIGVVAFSTDITERQRAEMAMRRSEVNYRSMVQGAPYGICRAGQDGRLFTVNPALVEMLGYESEEELLEVNLDRDIFREPGQREAVHRTRGRVLEGVEVEWKRKDGTPIRVRLSGRPVRDPEWPSTCYELIAENVTGQHALEEQLRQAQKMEAVGRLAGGVAHDFNNLLMVIKGHAELLRDSLPAQVSSQHKVDQISRAADRAARLTRQLLAFSRMQVLQPKLLDLGEVVSEMSKMLPRLIGEDIELRMEAKPGLGRVKADPGQIEQVIMNLAVNARDAMPKGGTLRIETADAEVDEAEASRIPSLTPGRYVLLSVTDTGTGMDAQTQARIFEPFFTTKEVGKGTGLGLSTVYGVVQQSGGTICVESELGKGTCFRIYLPRAEKESEPEAADPLAHEVPEASGTVLLAEDEKEVRELAREFLALSGYTVLEARDGAEALEIARSHAGPIDVLIADLVMPQLGGRELAQRMVEVRPETKVLFMSGYADLAPAGGEAARQGIHLTKPFTRGALARTVGEAVLARADGK